MKLAIPHQAGRLHGHFGGCREFTLVQVDPGQHTVLHTEVLAAPQHTPGAFPRWLRELGVEVVIAGGIGQRALANFARHGIEVRAGWPDATIAALVDAYLGGRLTNEPNGCEHHGHHHDHDHGHGHDHSHGQNHDHPHSHP